MIANVYEKIHFVFLLLSVFYHDELGQLESSIDT